MMERMRDTREAAALRRRRRGVDLRARRVPVCVAECGSLERLMKERIHAI
jgi:hypothetical protein